METKSKGDVIVLFRDDIIPRTKELLRKEEEHFQFLKEHQNFVNGLEIMDYISKSNDMIFHIRLRLGQYENHLNWLMENEK